MNDHVSYVNAFRGGWEGKTALLVRPASTQEVSEVMTICADAKMPVVPQGGNTGLTGASVPDASGEQILLSLDRMNEIRDIDPLNYTITVDAGCILANIQDAASNADRFFPLSLGAQGSCRIGGNLSTNAGGVNVLRYGNARDLVLGLEVVLPDGRVWNGLRRLRKDNTGYDLKQLFVGGEGTLGIITGAVLKLFPKPKDVQTCFAAIRDREAMIELLTLCRAASGDSVTSFEYIPRIIIDIDMHHLEGIIDPMERVYEHYVLIEFSGANPDSGMQAAMESMLESAFEHGIVLDAAIAQSEAHRNAFWFIRDGIVEASKEEGPASRTTSRSRLATSLGSSRRRTQNSARNCPDAALAASVTSATEISITASMRRLGCWRTTSRRSRRSSTIFCSKASPHSTARSAPSTASASKRKPTCRCIGPKSSWT